jgi:hypothetical protein
MIKAGNLSTIFDAYDFEELSADIMLKFAIHAGYAGLKAAKEGAPVLTGELRDSIYMDIDQTEKKITVKVAIPTSIPYAFPIVFGDKRHQPNPFMAEARDAAMREGRRLFKKITREALIEMNNKGRGK